MCPGITNRFGDGHFKSHSPSLSRGSLVRVPAITKRPLVQGRGGRVSLCPFINKKKKLKTQKTTLAEDARQGASDTSGARRTER